MWQEHEQGSQRQRDWNEVDGERFQRHGEAYLKERSVMRNEDDVGGVHRVHCGTRTVGL